MPDAPDAIAQLVRKFDLHRDAYVAPGYNEEELRAEFLDPFFELLGWDVANRSHSAEQYKDLVREHLMKAGAPDYCFRFGGSPKFYVEAKKPACHLAEDPGPAFQLRGYSWTAKLPVGILTDFEEFAVYDCRHRPRENDSARVARREYLTFRDYTARWDWLAATFSKDAVQQGAFDRYAGSEEGRGVATVDEEFLKDIESWRDALAHDIARRNRISPPDLNAAVQSTIDRILFLRMAEDRGTEPRRQLEALLNGNDVYARLRVHYRNADDRYNSGLFHFSPEPGRATPPDGLTPGLDIGDKVLKDILKSLYYPSPYMFAVMPPDILGSVYEQFLGKVIHLTPGGQARVEEKPEVKKAGGVYYTPKYIVDYIVEQTVGRMLPPLPDVAGVAASYVAHPPPGVAPSSVAQPRAATPHNKVEEARGGTHRSPPTKKMRILDPACGSGSFLVGAYRRLLDWHREWYVNDGPENHAKQIVKGPDGWLLTTAEKKRILLNNIFGVDIDRQAVEVTKLNLLLCVLENERQLNLIAHERALPDLDSNIKCGNSLIGPDFFTGQLLPDDEEMRRVNPFDWKAEFPQVFPSPSGKTSSFPSPSGKTSSFPSPSGRGQGEGGFDCVIGNPPYVRQESLSDFKAYFQSHYEAFDGAADLYAYFMEKGLFLLRKGGLFGIIVSSSFLRTTYGEPLRRTLKKHAAILRIVDFGGLAVFENAKDTYVCIPVLEKGAAQDPVRICHVSSPTGTDLDDYVMANEFEIPQERLSPEAWSLKSNDEAAIFTKIMGIGIPLGEYVEGKLFYGLKTGLNEAFEISDEQVAALTKSSAASKAIIKRFVGGQDIRRYRFEENRRHLIVIPCGWTRQQMAKSGNPGSSPSERAAWKWFETNYPRIATHIAQFVDGLKKRQDQGEYWWELRPCDYYEYIEAPKIVFPDICKHPRFCVDRKGVYLANTAYCIGTDDLYLLGILNSRLFWFAIGNISIPFGVRAGEYRYRLIYQYMEKVPIRVIDFSNSADKSRHDRMVTLVESMWELHQRFAKARSEADRDVLRRQIDATDRDIDRLVYDLYVLTPDEIRLIEESPRS